MTIKKYYSLVTVCLFCFLATVSGQTENAERESLAAMIVHYFNKNKHDSIYMLYTAETKKTVTLPKTREFFDKFHKQLGSIREYSFIEEKNYTSKYRAVFEKEIYWMIFSAWKGEVSALYFMIYDGPAPPKKD